MIPIAAILFASFIILLFKGSGNDNVERYLRHFEETDLPK